MSADPNDKNYDPDYDPTYEYHNEWKGLIYPRETEKKMEAALTHLTPNQRVFSNKSNYLYHARHYKLMNDLYDERKEAVLDRINKKVKESNPLQFKNDFHRNGIFTTITPVGGAMSLVGFGFALYALRYIRK